MNKLTSIMIAKTASVRQIEIVSFNILIIQKCNRVLKIDSKLRSMADININLKL